MHRVWQFSPLLAMGVGIIVTAVISAIMNNTPQVVFMIPNAPLLPETVAYLADIGVTSVNVLQLIDINGQLIGINPTERPEAGRTRSRTVARRLPTFWTRARACVGPCRG